MKSLKTKGKKSKKCEGSPSQHDCSGRHLALGDSLLRVLPKEGNSIYHFSSLWYDSTGYGTPSYRV